MADSAVRHCQELHVEPCVRARRDARSTYVPRVMGGATCPRTCSRNPKRIRIRKPNTNPKPKTSPSPNSRRAVDSDTPDGSYGQPQDSSIRSRPEPAHIFLGTPGFSTVAWTTAAVAHTAHSTHRSSISVETVCPFAVNGTRSSCMEAHNLLWKHLSSPKDRCPCSYRSRPY
jgi:hypothetical protein